jgi:hypothetical protein
MASLVRAAEPHVGEAHLRRAAGSPKLLPFSSAAPRALPSSSSAWVNKNGHILHGFTVI